MPVKIKRFKKFPKGSKSPKSIIDVCKQRIKRYETDDKKGKKEILESKGHNVGSIDEFLGLSKEESQYIDLKLSISQVLGERRNKALLSAFVYCQRGCII